MPTNKCLSLRQISIQIHSIPWISMSALHVQAVFDLIKTAMSLSLSVLRLLRKGNLKLFSITPKLFILELNHVSDK